MGHKSLVTHGGLSWRVSDRLSQLVEYGTGYIELFDFADGAAAVLVSVDATYEVLGAAHHTDPQWVDSYYGEIKDGEVKVERGEKLDGLGEALLDNFTTLTQKGLAGLGQEVDDASYFLVTHGNQDAHRKYLTALGVIVATAGSGFTWGVTAIRRT